jgi:hypothetical protein
LCATWLEDHKHEGQAEIGGIPADLWLCWWGRDKTFWNTTWKEINSD